MKFLLPLIIIGAILASQAALASEMSLPACRTTSAERVALRYIKRGRIPRCQPMTAARTSNSVSGMSSPSSSLASSSSSSESISYPPDPLTDTLVSSQFLLLGETGPMLGGGKIFLEEEPLLVTSITFNLTTEVQTVQSMLVYDDQRRLLGRATLDPTVVTGRSYKLMVPVGRFTVGKRTERSVYVRPVLLAKDLGGLSNQLVQISSIVVKGTGEWSNQAYTSVAGTSSSSYPVFVTSRSVITSVTNAGTSVGGLTTGTLREIGSFTMMGRKTDPTAKIVVTKLVFTIQQTGGVTISSPSLAVDGINEKFPCTANATELTCSSIPESYGSATDAPRTFTLYGTASATDSVNASLQLALNRGGSSTTAGDIEWTDGTTTFNWLPFSGSIASGTRYQY